MPEFSFKSRGLQVSQYAADHTHVNLHTNSRRGEDASVEIEASHFPATSGQDDPHGPREEFATISFTHRQVERSHDGRETARNSDGVTFFGTLDDVEALHFALGELLEQAKGLPVDSASVRVIAKPVETVEE